MAVVVELVVEGAVEALCQVLVSHQVVQYRSLEVNASNLIGSSFVTLAEMEVFEALVEIGEVEVEVELVKAVEQGHHMLYQLELLVDRHIPCNVEVEQEVQCD